MRTWTSVALVLLLLTGCGDDAAILDSGPGPVVGGPPTAIIQGLSTDATNFVPCAAAQCTIPNVTDFQFQVTGRSENGGIGGFQWRLYRRGSTANAWEPFGFEAQFAANRDTVATDCAPAFPCSDPDTLWSVANDVITVYVRNRSDAPRDDGIWILEARVRDAAGLVSDEAAMREFVINHDPHSRLFEIPACDCPQPPPDCAARGNVPAGWITGIGRVDFVPADWILFCDGDTLPNLSTVRFYADGTDDARDAPLDPAMGLQDVKLGFRFEYSRLDYVNLNMPLSRPAQAMQLLELPPGWGTFVGASTSWRTCPFDYRFQASAVDEADRFDGVGATLEFSVGRPPALVQVDVPSVMVFVPTCMGLECPDVDPNTFGPDTLLVFGNHIPDALDPTEWATPLGLGFNNFKFPFRARGFDHPNDRNPPGGPVYYAPETEGRIRSWRFSFNCLEDGCVDVQLPRESIWIPDIPRSSDPVGRQVFDSIELVVPLDTLCVVEPCAAGAFTAKVPLQQRSGPYVFSVEGRDTEFIGEECRQPSDLGDNAAMFVISISALGQTTGVQQRKTTWLMYHQVRPARARP